jgi:hypothetical protein
MSRLTRILAEIDPTAFALVHESYLKLTGGEAPRRWEGRHHFYRAASLAQATLYLARAPKSNAIKRAYLAAAADAGVTAREPVPYHLRNGVTALMKAEGYGEGYRYVHDDPGARDQMTCLPEALKRRVYVEPDRPDSAK